MKTAVTPPLFLCDALDGEQREVVISRDEARHAGRSRRLRVGDPVHLTDGRGMLAEGRVTAIGKSPPSMTAVIDRSSLQAEPAIPVVLASALPKGERLYTLLDMATQLGMRSFQPLECHRSIVHWQQRMHHRCIRVLESAAKQCRQTRVPEILPPAQVADVIADAGDGTCLILGSVEGGSLCDGGKCIIPPSTRKIVILVGPEGGFDPAEAASLSASSHILPVRCGKQILRTETAAAALLAVTTQWLANPGDSVTKS